MTTQTAAALSENTIRRSAMLLIALIMVHFMAYPVMPFSENYQFPLVSFLIILIYGVAICETNHWNYSRLNKVVPFNSNPFRRVKKQVAYNFTGTIIVFSTLTIIQLLTIDDNFTWFGFFSYLFVCIMISLLETSAFVTKDVIKLYRKSKAPTTLKNIVNAAEKTDKLILQTGSRISNIEFDEVAYLHSTGGIVVLVNKDGNKQTTQYSSLNQLEEKIDSTLFFRVSRQHLLHYQAIQAIDCNTSNKQVNVTLKNGEEITVSRYKAAAFKKWYRHHTSNGNHSLA